MKISKLLCLGDSLTQAYNVDESECWVSLLRISTGLTCINAGISGDTTSGMLGRLENLLLKHKPSHLIVTGGTNDACFKIPTNIIMSNIHAITRQCKYYNVIPIIGIPLSVFDNGFELSDNQFTSKSEFIRQIDDLQKALRTFAQLNDFQSIDFAHNTNKDHLMLDGVHPNQTGHEQMAHIAKKSL